ncbi:MAG: DNA replication and repair protein RecF [Anaeroplasmataceae bacterium]|nr:DNA replication and repair protein RecF [Anaeroplasmataceae bacterium]MDE6242177.1 DNA replication and repair protein RecF [Anaeroplasmataceae bacterium]
MIQQLEVHHFRKFSNLKLDFKNKTVIFTGQNAVGKTTLLEAIYLISTSKSHRTNDLSTLIQNNEDITIIQIQENKKYKMILTKEGKQSFINDISYPKLSDFIGGFPVVMFSPSDLELIQGSKSVRRRFLDLELSLIDKSYLRAIMGYKKLVKERNELLKIFTEEKKLVLDVITKQICEYISKIYNIRTRFLEKLNQKLEFVCKNLDCEKLKLSYIPTYDINHLEESFKSKLSYDLITKTTNIGLHRDDFKIELDTLEAKEFASEGQMRNAILAIKFALKEIYKEKGQNIILLLDDVFASIDQKRINHIMEYIKNEHQTFITTTSLFNIPDELLKEAQIIRL